MCKEKVCNFDKENAVAQTWIFKRSASQWAWRRPFHARAHQGWALHARSEPHPDLRQAPQSWPKGDFIEFVDVAVFLRILG